MGDEIFPEQTGKPFKGSGCGWGEGDNQLVVLCMLVCDLEGEPLDGRDLGALLSPSYSLAIQDVSSLAQ